MRSEADAQDRGAEGRVTAHLHMFVEHGCEGFPGFLERMDPIAARPPFDASPPHEESSEKVVAGADFQGHGITAVALGQLDRVGQGCDYLGASDAAAFGHAVNRITGVT